MKEKPDEYSPANAATPGFLGLEALRDRALALAEQAEPLLACNERTAAHGLTLTRQQALALEKDCRETLQRTGRLALGGSILPRLAEAFCDSPYVSPRNYEATLRELAALFYEAKNETWDRVADETLIDYMKAAFDGVCQGSLELLAGRELPRLARQIHEGGAQEPPKEQKEADDEGAG